MEALLILAPFLDLGRDAAYAAIAVFTRVGAAVALLPGFGEITLPPRIKLAAALAFTAIIWPAAPVPPDFVDPSPALVFQTMTAEAVAGAMLGLSVRLLLMALQTAGTIAGQSTSIAQMFNGGLTAEMQPAFSNLLTLAGVALAFALGMPAHVAAALIGSYDVLPFGVFPLAEDVALWGVDRVGGAFAIAVALSAPFIVAALAYNVALGAINKAMPQLMVAMVGAPAITLGSIALMALAAPTLLQVWADHLLATMTAPLAAAP